MAQKLDTKQFVPLTSGEREAIGQEAADRDISIGLLSRSLLLHAFEHDLDGTGLEARIEEEKAASRRRISEGARAAVNARYGDDGEGDR